MTNDMTQRQTNNENTLSTFLRRYPRTVAEVVDDEAKYKTAVLEAMREFKAAHPWRGTVEERKSKFLALHAKLCAAYGFTSELKFDVPEPEAEHGNGCCNVLTKEITLTGKLSVVTYLHEFAHAVFGRSEHKACQWSVNLYRRIFPQVAARMGANGHLIVKR